jgi:hypothetical protein
MHQRACVVYSGICKQNHYWPKQEMGDFAETVFTDQTRLSMLVGILQQWSTEQHPLQFPR